jgi:hypothetical protein
VTPVIAPLLSAVFIVLAAWHFFMAVAGPRNAIAAVPTVDGKPLFVPSAAATVLVGLVLASFAVLVLAKAGTVWLGLPQWTLAWMCAYLAIGLAARAVGDFRHVGFFKKVKSGAFARMDTFVYSPLCAVLAAGVSVVGFDV